jgi:tetratricopeptide (TPR) repeat protein
LFLVATFAAGPSWSKPSTAASHVVTPTSGDAADAATTAGPPSWKRIFTPIGVRKKGTTDRLMINHAEGLTATLAEHDGKAIVTFNHAVRVNLAHVNEVLPAMFAPLAETADGMGFSFTLPPGRHITQDHDATFLVIEIPAVGDGKASTDTTPPVPKQPVAVAQDKAAAASPQVVAAPAPKPPVPLPAPAQAAVPEPKSATATPVSDHPLAAKTPPPPVSQPDPAHMQVLARTSGRGQQIRYADLGDGASVRFDWNVPAAAAIFARGSYVWAVFDQVQNFTFDQHPPTNLRGLGSITQLPSASASILRLEMASGFRPSVRRAGNAWIIDLRTDQDPPGAPIEPVIHRDGAASVTLAAMQPAHHVGVIDPDSGENLIVVPLPELGQGIASSQDFADFQLLASIQGIVVKAVSDQLSVEESPTEVTITASGGLSLSTENDTKLPPALPELKGTLLDPADWAGKAERPFLERQETLLHQAVAAADSDKTAARVALARFLFANDMGPESLGVLKTTERDVPNLTDDPGLRLLQGAAEEMSNQFDSAAHDLNDPSLDGRVDTALWRAKLAADQANWHDAATMGEQGLPALRSYPPALRRRLSVPLADAMFWSGDYTNASTLAADILASDPSQGERDYAMCLQGRIAASHDDIDQAMRLWQKVAQSPDIDLGRAEANYAMAVTKLDKGQISRTDAIQAIDRLRFAWRGDDFEVRVLRKLADLYAADSNYRMAFETLQRVVQAYPDSLAARDATAAMQKIFVDTFLGPNADTMAPLTSLALYEQFKELTPSGPQGDAIIRKLADRLVAIDLLERAGNLLDDQVRTRLTGLDQARVGAQLALVRLMDHRPADAIAVLDLPVASGLPDELTRQRIELRARADAELDKPDDALQALADDASADADALRAEIYLKTENWPKLADTLLQSVRNSDATAPLSDADAATVVRIATAMTLAHDTAGLTALKKRFGDRMERTPQRDAFRVVAGDPGSQGDSAQPQLADRVAQISDLQSFMSQYRQRLQQGTLSSLN